jgi:hypothetical protein
MGLGLIWMTSIRSLHKRAELRLSAVVIYGLIGAMPALTKPVVQKAKRTTS